MTSTRKHHKNRPTDRVQIDPRVVIGRTDFSHAGSGHAAIGRAPAFLPTSYSTVSGAETLRGIHRGVPL